MEDPSGDPAENPAETKKEDVIEEDNSPMTKDRRTVFVSQLVMRADERDIKHYFRQSAGKVNEVILLRDRRTGRHKGCAYVELARLSDVPGAVALNGETPDFQRFPILVKASEAEKNYVLGSKLGPQGSIAGVDANTGLVGSIAAGDGADIARAVAAIAASFAATGATQKVAQKVYVGSVDRNVTQAQLQALFSQFGELERVVLQLDPTTGISRGFAFLSYKDPKAANLAIQTMSGQMLAGRPL